MWSQLLQFVELWNVPGGRPGIFLEFSQIACSSFSLALLFALTVHLLFTLRWRAPFHSWVRAERWRRCSSTWSIRSQVFDVCGYLITCTAKLINNYCPLSPVLAVNAKLRERYPSIMVLYALWSGPRRRRLWQIPPSAVTLWYLISLHMCLLMVTLPTPLYRVKVVKWVVGEENTRSELTKGLVINFGLSLNIYNSMHS